MSPRLAGRLAFEMFCTTGPRRIPAFTPAPDAVEQFRAGAHRVTGYVWHGGGPTVLLVHGWNGGSGDLAAFIAPLRDAGRRVLALDLPGHGRSGGKRVNLPAAVAAVHAALLRAPEIEAVIAHSFGVPATVLAAGRGAPLPKAVFLSGPVSMEPYLQRFEQVLGLAPEVRAAMRARIRTVLDRGGLDTMELQAVAPRLGGRALIVHDRGDREVPFMAAQALHRAWSGSELVGTDGLGHRRILSDPAVVERAVRFVTGWAEVARPEKVPAEAERPELRVVGG